MSASGPRLSNKLLSPPEEAGVGARQNRAMDLLPRPLRLASGICALAFLASCQSSALERGDVAFRRGDYLGAWHQYQQAGDPTSDAVLAARLERTRWFLVETNLLNLLASGMEEQVLTLLPRVAPLAPPDRVQQVANMESRARDQLGARHTSRAEALLESGDSDAALRELTLALSWYPEDDLAANLLEMTTERLERERALGDELYFQGMDHLRHGEDLRARTSFHHAAMLHGPESRAEQRYANLSADLASASRAEARTLLDADLIGPAFFAIRSADRLEPEHAETMKLIARLQARVNSEKALIAGDLAIRGGRTGLADEILAELIQWDVPAHRRVVQSLAQRNEELRLDVDYRYGRALELDEQIVRAAEVYLSMIERGDGFGWADVELRLSNLKDRLGRAKIAYQAALDAEAADDAAGYRARLEETVRAASDYADALERLLAVRVAEAAATATTEPGA